MICRKMKTEIKIKIDQHIEIKLVQSRLCATLNLLILFLRVRFHCVTLMLIDSRC